MERLDDKELICFFISIQCQGWLLGRSGSEALGSEALISQSTGLGRIEASNMADGLRRAEFKGAGLGLEVLEWLGYAGAKAMGSDMRSRLGKEALAKEALAIRLLVR